jgi:hypothetical protein
MFREFTLNIQMKILNKGTQSPAHSSSSALRPAGFSFALMEVLQDYAAEEVVVAKGQSVLRVASRTWTLESESIESPQETEVSGVSRRYWVLDEGQTVRRLEATAAVSSSSFEVSESESSSNTLIRPSSMRRFFFAAVAARETAFQSSVGTFATSITLNSESGGVMLTVLTAPAQIEVMTAA